MSLHKLKATMPLLALVFGAGQALAAVSPEDAARLGSELTPVGAERAGNADGTIPAWNGGMTTPPPGYEPGGQRIDPFAEESPLLTITAENYQQHAERLTAGQIALFERYPGFRMPIYPTHRTAAAPQFVYDFTKKNATRSRLNEDGSGVIDAYGGYPFPIPENGFEVLWNHNLRWLGSGSRKNYINLTVYPNGEATVGQGELWETFPYYDPEGTLESFEGDNWLLMLQYSLPVRRKGEVILVRDPLNAVTSPRQAWQYIPGQRRVRRAPTISHDTPNAQFAGQATYDDAFMFNGTPDRYNVELIDKREVYIPYNSNGMLLKAQEGLDTIENIATPHFPDPELARWELHRVWVIEATLKEDSRHLYEKRTFYVDEDSWAIAATDIYDGRDNLWRVGFANLLNAYDVPLTAIRSYWHTDLQNGAYAFNEVDLEPVRYYEGEGDNFYTPAQVRKMSRR